MQADNSAGLAIAARRRRDLTLQRAQAALALMAKGPEPVTVARLADKAGVSRSWIYTQPAIQQQIDDLSQRGIAPTRRASPADSRASAESLRRRLELSHKEIAHLRAENKQLAEAVARAHGQLRHDAATT